MSKLVNKNKIFSPVDTRDYNLDTVGVSVSDYVLPWIKNLFTRKK